MPKIQIMDYYYCYSESMPTGGGWQLTSDRSPPVVEGDNDFLCATHTNTFPPLASIPKQPPRQTLQEEDPYDVFQGWSPDSAEDVKPENAALLWGGNDPFIHGGPSPLSRAAVGGASAILPPHDGGGAATPSIPRREEAIILADHALYCRKAPEAPLIAEQSFMDPFYGVDLPPHDALYTFESASASCSANNSFPSTPAPPQHQHLQQHLTWMDQFPSSNEDNSCLPADLDSVNVDWDYWMDFMGEKKRYGGGEGQNEQKVLHTLQQPCSSNSSSMVNSPGMVPFKLSTIKEEPEYSPQGYQEDIKVPAMSTPLCSAPHSTVPTRSSSPDLAAMLMAPKSRRGRPKKIRVFEDKEKMSAEERRKAMNRDAALRYREKKKEEGESARLVHYDLVANNIRLKHRISELQDSIAKYRAHFRKEGFSL